MSARERVCAHHDVGLGHADVYRSGMSCCPCLFFGVCIYVMVCMLLLEEGRGEDYYFAKYWLGKEAAGVKKCINIDR